MRRGVVGRYLREWGAEVVCLQETLMEEDDNRLWRALGWGEEGAHVVIEAVGRSGAIALAWRDNDFEKREEWRGRHVMAAFLTRRIDGRSWVVASAYGPHSLAQQLELLEDLVELATKFQGTRLIIGGDFNITLEAADRPNGLGRQDSGSSQFRAVLAQTGLQEMGPSDQRFTWRASTDSRAWSRLDRFLCSVELLDLFPAAEVNALTRPLSDHTPILWKPQGEPHRPSYFKMDHSWFCEDGFMDELANWWEAHPAWGSASMRLVAKLNGLRRHLIGLRRGIREERTRIRDEALNSIHEFDALEDTRPLSDEEHAARKKF